MEGGGLVEDWYGERASDPGRRRRVQRPAATADQADLPAHQGVRHGGPIQVLLHLQLIALREQHQAQRVTVKIAGAVDAPAALGGPDKGGDDRVHGVI